MRRRVRIYLIVLKNKYHAEVTARYGNKISRLRCDNLGEYISQEFKVFCKNEGIIVEYTVPYTPEINGVAECMYRTLEKSRCMIFDSNLLKEMWEEAIFCATYLTNRSPTSYLIEKTTPAEI